jgi:RNA polymerase sigma-32 factor
MLADKADGDCGVTKERARQITKRATATIAELCEHNPRFALMAK